MRPSGDKRLLEALGIEIKARRRELKASQEEIAGRCALDRPYLTLIESGRKQPTLSVLFKLAQALELTFAELASRVEDRYHSLPSP